MKYLKVLGVAFVFISQIFQTAYSYESNTTLIRKKISHPSIDVHIELNRNNKAYNLPKVREITLRDSGRNHSLMFIRNTDFHYLGNVGFYASELSLSLKPNNPALPVVFDDPTSFALYLHQGTILLTPVALEALFNDHVFNFPAATVKNLKVSTTSGVLTLSGDMFRGEWIPFSMKGRITLKQGHLLYFNPTTVVVNGVDTTKVLAAANVKLAELLTIKAPGAELVGSSIILDAQNLFPPPKLFMKISSVNLEDKGLVIHFNDGYHPAFPTPLVPNSSYMIVRGGDVKFMRSIALDASLQIDNADPDKDLNFCLYRYREQLTQGSLTFTKTGAIHVFFPKVNCTY